jgi:hypothetical protein
MGISFGPGAGEGRGKARNRLVANSYRPRTAAVEGEYGDLPAIREGPAEKGARFARFPVLTS